MSLTAQRAARWFVERHDFVGQLQYVFGGTASGEVEFFVADEVIGITVVEPPRVSGGGGWT